MKPAWWHASYLLGSEDTGEALVLDVSRDVDGYFFAQRIAEGALVVDCRTSEAFAGAHIPGALNVGAGTSFPTWAGSILPETADVLLVVDDPGQLRDIDWKLLRIGYREPVGWLGGGMRACSTAAQPLDSLPLWTTGELDVRRREKNNLFILNVRQPSEWHAGHVPGAHHISGGELPAQIEEVPGGKPVAV
jgi:hydroxyacylglutathione hydrolase